MTLAEASPPLRLSPEDVAARLTWMEIAGTTTGPDDAALLDRGIGGVVLFARNVESPEQVRALTADLRRRAHAPLRIAVDQEGGHIVRIGEPLTRFPSQMAVGATRSPALAYAVARAAGRELASLGIDVALAPVLDVASDPRNPVIGSRSFGASPGLVALLGAASIRGYLDAGVAPTPKHFPGHGRTPFDSHLERPVVRGDVADLARLDLPPFQAAIAAASPILMIAHVAYEGLTRGVPATLSSGAMETLLRDRLGFRGIALTDAMVMDAVADGRAIPEACAAALAAGADVVMPLAPQRRAIAEIARAVRDGRLDERRIAASLARIGALEARLRRGGHPDLAGAATRAPLPEAARPFEAPPAAHRRLAATVARGALTLVHSSWPWSRGSVTSVPALGADTSVLVVEFAPSVASPIEDGIADGGTLAARLAERLPRAQTLVIRDEPDRTAAEARAVQVSRSTEVVVLATRDGHLDRRAQMLASAIAAGGRPIVHAALRSPVDLAVFPSQLGVATYSDVPASLDALADALTSPSAGADRYSGTLPMPIDRVAPHLLHG